MLAYLKVLPLPPEFWIHRFHILQDLFTFFLPLLFLPFSFLFIYFLSPSPLPSFLYSLSAFLPFSVFPFFFQFTFLSSFSLSSFLCPLLPFSLSLTLFLTSLVFFYHFILDDLCHFLVSMVSWHSILVEFCEINIHNANSDLN